jgi:hypothetical protein
MVGADFCLQNSGPIGSQYAPDMWKADTFEGEYGFNLVKSANIITFICNDLIDKCDNNFIFDIYAK